MRLLIDSAVVIPATAHGYAPNSQGFKLLRLPILPLIHSAPERRRKAGVGIDWTPGQWSEVVAFVETACRLSIVLRELHHELRHGATPAMHLPDNQVHRTLTACERIPLFADLAFVYLRRVADHFARASRYVLFKHFESAPREYKRLRSFLADARAVERCTPLCDVARLQRAAAEHSQWFEVVRARRSSDEAARKGIRDALEHHPVFFSTTHHADGDGPWEIDLAIGQPNVPGSYRAGIIKTLRTAVGDLCEFWSGVCDAVSDPLDVAAAEWVVPYGRCLVVHGEEEDGIGFWPPATADPDGTLLSE